jgi:small-conductance mechanosensitive channel
VAIWMNNPWELRPALSDLHEEIWQALQERGIVIAFPQVDVHFDPAVTKGIGRLSGAAA